jgi:hypothetical protein
MMPRLSLNSPAYKKMKAEQLIEIKEELEKRKPKTVFAYLSTYNSVFGKKRIESRMKILEMKRKRNKYLEVVYYE